MTIDIKELPQLLQEQLASLALSEEITIYDGSNLRARLIPIPAPVTMKRQLVPNLHPGAIETSPDFDEPLPDQFWCNDEAVT